MPKIGVHGGASNKYEPPARVPARDAVAKPSGATYIVGEHGPELFPGTDLPPMVLAAVADGFEIVAVPTPEPEPVPEVVEVAPPSVYVTWLLRPLRDECVRRGLSATGGKDDLVARLAASDAAPAEPEPVTEGGEQTSAGISTSTFSESPPTRSEPNGPADPKPAPTTENP